MIRVAFKTKWLRHRMKIGAITHANSFSGSSGSGNCAVAVAMQFPIACNSCYHDRSSGSGMAPKNRREGTSPLKTQKRNNAEDDLRHQAENPHSAQLLP